MIHNFDREALVTVASNAKAEKRPQFAKAKLLVSNISSNPPKGTSKADVWPYFKSRVLDDMPKRYRYDDVFWSCFLTLLYSSGVPQGVPGGIFDQLVFRVYDDFNPGDVV